MDAGIVDVLDAMTVGENAVDARVLEGKKEGVINC